MSGNNSERISANFGDVAAGADAFIQRAKSLIADLDQFKSSVQQFLGEHWTGGDATEAFTSRQGNWDKEIQQLNTTLQGAAQLVHTGNSDLQSRDSSLAGLF